MRIRFKNEGFFGSRSWKMKMQKATKKVRKKKKEIRKTKKMKDTRKNTNDTKKRKMKQSSYFEKKLAKSKKKHIHPEWENSEKERNLENIRK